MKLAIFDFDGTISTKDSFLDIIFFVHGPAKTILGILALSPVIILHLLHVMPRGKTKECFLTLFFKGLKEERFKKLAQNYVEQRLPHIIRPAAQERIAWHKAQGHTVVVVSASIEEYLKIWCQQQQIQILATRAEVQNGQFTGKLATPNCHGEEKVTRVQNSFDLRQFDYVYAYGDSEGDLPLKKIANEFHYQPFRQT